MALSQDIVPNTVQLGGTAKDVTAGKVAHGLMGITHFRVPTISDEDAFEAIKTGVDALPPGVKMFLSSAEFYGPKLSTANVELLARFYERYPAYADKTFLSVKGGLKPGALHPDSSPENLRRSVDLINATLRGTKKLDLFAPARVDPNVPVEESTKTLVEFVEEGKFDHIGLSECSAKTLRRANAVHPIAVAEIEVSLWSYEEETKKVLATAEELGIAIAAYSPLGHGFLTGTIRSSDDLDNGDVRKRFPRFKDENIKHNIAIVDAIKAIAERKQITPAQLCIAWVGSLGPQVMPLPGSSNKTRTLENIAAADIKLSQDDLTEIAAVLARHEVRGNRLTGDSAFLWG
ncbi:Pyridoxal reductase [Grifola frondosa]|uniref:Pyridoxal reductase n=1 Tax=Grifola frondosa TaxID=5627 RepID=A0A1C7LY19_GRIFR|nr:Pyridoxal reductase [Grifola frondosa]